MPRNDAALNDAARQDPAGHPSAADVTGADVIDGVESESSGEQPTRGVRFGGPREAPTPPVSEDPRGTGPPVPEDLEVVRMLDRWFAFIDVSGFTSFTDTHGARAAIDVLSRFRGAVRTVTARRGVRVLKWLGDGVMLVGTEPGPVVAAASELAIRFDRDPFEVHAGICGGPVLLFEGDDYVGPSVNRAARLCEAAGPGEVLASGSVVDHLPDWVEVRDRRSVHAKGVGDLPAVVCLAVRREAVEGSTVA